MLIPIPNRHKYPLNVVATILLFLAVAIASVGCDSGNQAGGQPILSSQPSPTSQAGTTSQASGGSQAGSAEDHYIQGALAYGKGNLDQAIAEFTTAIKLDPSKSKYYAQRGSAYDRKGAYDSALADYIQVTKIDSDTANQSEDPTVRDAELSSVYHLIGTIYYNKGEYSQAITNLSASINLMVSTPEVYEQRGDAYKAIGDKGKAIADYKTELSLDGKSAKYGPETVTYTLANAERQRLEQKIKDLGAS